MLYAAQDLFEEADVNRDDLVHCAVPESPVPESAVPESTVSVAVLNGLTRAAVVIVGKKSAAMQPLIIS